MRQILLALTLIGLTLTTPTPAVTAAHAAQPGQDTQTTQDTAQVDEAPPPAPLVRLAADLATIAVRIEEVETNLAAAPPESRAVFDFKCRRRWTEHHEVLGRRVDGIERARGTAEEDSLVIVDAAVALQRELVTLEAWLGEVSAEAATIGRALVVAPPTDVVQTEIELHGLRTNIDDLFRAFTEDYERAIVLGLDLSTEQSIHQAALVERTELLGAGLEQALEEEADYRDWITKPGVDTIATALRIAAIGERVLGTTESLQAMVDLMARSDLEVSGYRRLIVTATGDIGIVEVLDTEVLSGLIAEWSDSFLTWFQANIDTVILRLVIIVMVMLLARLLSGVVRRAGRRVLASKQVDLSSLVKNLAISGLSKLVWIVAFFVTLSLVGIDLGPMLAGLGIAGFVIGFALQDTLSNFASGLMIMVYRPFDVGDWITAAGVSGTVKDLTLVSTVIRTVDNKRVTIPNGKCVAT